MAACAGGPLAAQTPGAGPSWQPVYQFDEDDRQRRDAEVPGLFDVVEVQSDPVGAERDADQQEEEQTGKPYPGRQAGADDACEQHEAAHQ